MLVNPLLIMQIPSRYLFVALLRCNDMLEQIPAVGTFNRDYIHMSTFTLWQSDALSIFVTHYPNVFIYVNHSKYYRTYNSDHQIIILIMHNKRGAVYPSP